MTALTAFAATFLKDHWKRRYFYTGEPHVLCWGPGVLL